MIYAQQSLSNSLAYLYAKRCEYENKFEPIKPVLPTNCKNCAAPLNWNLERCEYCSTQFQQSPQILFNPELVNAEDLSKPIVPIKPTTLDKILQAGLSAAVMMMPRR